MKIYPTIKYEILPYNKYEMQRLIYSYAIKIIRIMNKENLPSL